jgi:hypothetical protein
MEIAHLQINVPLKPPFIRDFAMAMLNNQMVGDHPPRDPQRNGNGQFFMSTVDDSGSLFSPFYFSVARFECHERVDPSIIQLSSNYFYHPCIQVRWIFSCWSLRSSLEE